MEEGIFRVVDHPEMVSECCQVFLRSITSYFKFREQISTDGAKDGRR